MRGYYSFPPKQDMLLGGGREFGVPGVGIMRAANLTPDIRTGLGGWNRDVFVARFTAIRGSWSERPDTTLSAQ